ncbi:MAG TPA: PKD domain-containing protein, partial [Flavobacteriales bacterium]|nr:PKD domain-containing protein [Flavobacteriales bacterium]
TATSLRAQQVPPGFSDALVLGGFEEPVGFTFDGNGRMYVWEKRGKVWIVENGVRLATPLIDISPEVGNWRDHGCLGFALDPQFLTNGRFYLMYAVDRHYLMNFGTANYNAATDEYYQATIMRITRYSAPGPHNVADPASRFVLVGETKKTGVPMTHESHSTGSLVFGTDGTLLASVGDGGTYSNADLGSDLGTYYIQALADSILRPEENVGAFRAQLVNCMNGKVLRIDPNTGNGIASNPYYDAAQPRAPKSRVWAMGLRNPYRMTKRPGTGSTDPAEGKPGVLYIGDVGWGQWEDLNVCAEPGLNFGWPMFEGLEARADYMLSPVANMDAPNPLYSPGGCAQRYFNFQDLLKQDTPVHLNGHPNPCDAAQQVPANIPTFFHHRPEIDWNHGAAWTRTGIFIGNMAATIDLEDPNSPIPGTEFVGNASVGGAWITGLGWPVGYQNVYMHGDYGAGWIKRFAFDEEDECQEVFDFGSDMGAVVCINEGPDGALWYVRYETGEIRKVSPIGVTNLPPIAVATQDVQYGPGPLTVHFNGTGSSDPEQGALTYAWNFGDTGNSSSPTPTHVFTAPAGVPTSYTVTLTVTDPQGASNSVTLLVSVNNTPPHVAITSFPDGQLYPVGEDTTFTLTAQVSDTEHSAAQLTYSWRTYLHHNAHNHPESAITTVTGTTVVSGEGCYTDSYHYRVELTVTDAGGLSTSVSHNLYPRCTGIPPTAVITSDITQGEAPFNANLSGASSLDNGSITDYFWDFGDGTTASGVNVAKTFSEPGIYYVTLTARDNDGNEGSTTKLITVYDPLPPQCVGPVGGLLREYWTNIGPGANITDLTTNPLYPDAPRAMDIITSFQGPSDWADNYGTRVRGYLIPQEDGEYHFTVTGDDAVVFFLSPNADPQFMQALCSTPAWTGVTEFTKYPQQNSAAVQLKAGRYYYVELLHKEGFGNDHFAVWWQRPSVPTRTVIGGPFLASWQGCSPALGLRMLLQGAYDPAVHLMRDDLRTDGLIPLEEPFTALGFTHAGNGGNETLDPQLLQQDGMNAIVDWVLVELREPDEPEVVFATRSALLQRDGDVIAADGHPQVLFDVRDGTYLIAVRHRNHLGAMSANTIALGKSQRGQLDLSSGFTVTYGTNARVQLGPDHWGLWCGDVHHDEVLRYTGAANDRDPILVDIGGVVPTAIASGYLSTDVNMDGLVKYTGVNNDRDPILVRIGGTVPTNSVTGYYAEDANM